MKDKNLLNTNTIINKSTFKRFFEGNSLNNRGMCKLGGGGWNETERSMPVEQ